MSEPAIRPATGRDADALGMALLERFSGQGYTPVEPGLLLAAELVLDHMGEDIRRRLLLTTDPSGAELCLRPDFTLPVALHHVATGGNAARYAYAGMAFRFPLDADPLRVSAEFRQAGLEAYGDDDPVAADIAMLRTALEAVRSAAPGPLEVTLGDVGLFGAVVAALDLAPHWAQRAHRLFWRQGDVAGIIAALGGAGVQSDGAALGSALADMDAPAARSVVEEIMGIAGVEAVGGRRASQIAERFVERAAAARDGGLPGRAVEVLSDYLAILAPPEEALERITAIAIDHDLDLDRAVADLRRRIDRLPDLITAVDDVSFGTAFGRRIEYYTGFVFELRARSLTEIGPLAGGGRYDRFLADLGAASGLPAVGCSIYVDRVTALARAGR